MVEAGCPAPPGAGGENAPGVACAAGSERTAEAGSGVAAGGDPEPASETAPEIEVVVARYLEDTVWTQALGLPCLVYDKSGQAGTSAQPNVFDPSGQLAPSDTSGQAGQVVSPDTSGRVGALASADTSDWSGPVALPNIGRETHTYLTHIVRRYETLAQHTVFVQADPFEHMGPGANPASFRERILQNVRLGVKFTGFAWYKLKCDRQGRPHALAEPQKAGKWPGYGKDIPVGEVYEALFRGPTPETFLTQAPAGLLFVARERILARPKAFYRKALALVEADPDDARNTGHAFERLWPVIFSGNQALNKNHY